MRSAILRGVVGLLFAAGLPSAAVCSAEGEATTKTLPTLLIKGEVVSVDAADPSATLLKVKDRYGFETPIYLTPETKISQGDAPLAAANLANGTAVEVEYNFDVNTAKRHAVSVKAATQATTAAVPAAAMAPAQAAPAAEPAVPSMPAPMEAPASAATTPAAQPQEAAPAAQ